MFSMGDAYVFLAAPFAEVLGSPQNSRMDAHMRPKYRKIVFGQLNLSHENISLRGHFPTLNIEVPRNVRGKNNRKGATPENRGPRELENGQHFVLHNTHVQKRTVVIPWHSQGILPKAKFRKRAAFCASQRTHPEKSLCNSMAISGGSQKQISENGQHFMLPNTNSQKRTFRIPRQSQGILSKATFSG